MSKVIDSTTVKFIIFVLSLIWINLIIKNFFGAAIIAALFSLVVWLIISKINEKKHPVYYDKKRLYDTLSLLGNTYTLSLFAKAKSYINTVSNNILVENKILYYSAFRFSPLSPDDITVAYREAIENLCDSIVILCRSASRPTLLLAASLPLDTKIVTAPDVYKTLKENDCLPPLIENKSVKAVMPPFKAFLSTVFSEGNVKYYLFTGAVLALTSFITPHKTYYVICASVSLLLALIAKIYNK